MVDGGESALGVGEQGFDLVHAAADKRPERPSQGQPWPGANQFRRQRCQPPVYRHALSALKERLGVVLHQAGSPPGVSGGQRMLDRFGGPPAALVPRCCPEVQLLDPFSAFLLQEAVQDIGEEVVVAVPAPLVVQRDDEQVLPL